MSGCFWISLLFKLSVLTDPLAGILRLGIGLKHSLSDSENWYQNLQPTTWNCHRPHGVPASKTIQSVHILRTMLESLSEQITGIESKYLEKVHINSALTRDMEKDYDSESVRADTTKFNAGTLPLNMYQNNIPPKYASIDLCLPTLESARNS
ncbi:unnamed protein product [Mytilus coruscus]|uniref:Uncharacterized protein n=1 Tax=Mytilus coruscus TaxID=42192 RepID=A0A6J8BPR9_MYTCO|nr:unnamed protein product [Mytilus coruscus]